MTEGIVIAIITAGLSLVGVVITVIYGNKKTTAAVKEHTDVTLYRLQQLEKKQDIHNGVIERVYNLEKTVELLTAKSEAIENTVNDLAQYHKEKK